MVEEQKSELFFLGIFPRCPYNKPVLQLIKIALMALGTVGLIFLNLWVAVVYLIYYFVFFFLAMPLIHCQYCYYSVKETTIDKKKGKTIVRLLPVDKWRGSYLKKHVAYGKKWGFNFFILWFLPIILIIISFFLSFSIFALISLFGFIAVLAVMMKYMSLKVCPTCAIQEECHSSF